MQNFFILLLRFVSNVNYIYKLLHPICCIDPNKHSICITFSIFFSLALENSVDPDQLASSEAS